MGSATRLESPVETHSIFVVFFASVVVFLTVLGGGVNVDIVHFIE